MTLTPLMTSKVVPEGLEFALAGSWTAAHSECLEQLVDGAVREAAKAQRIAIDMAGIDELDTLGAWLLERLTRNFKSNGKHTRVTGLKPLIAA
jgi:phospholipid/cholesterol/gamma-HCH transport system permease protein